MTGVEKKKLTITRGLQKFPQRKDKKLSPEVFSFRKTVLLKKMFLRKSVKPR